MSFTRHCTQLPHFTEQKETCLCRRKEQQLNFMQTSAEKKKYFQNNCNSHLPVNSLTSAFDCCVFMHNMKRPKIIHCDLVCAVLLWAGTWPLIDGHPIMTAPFYKELFVLPFQHKIMFLVLRKFLRKKIFSWNVSHHLEYWFYL
jgi:hypothetical protein